MIVSWIASVCLRPCGGGEWWKVMVLADCEQCSRLGKGQGRKELNGGKGCFMKGAGVNGSRRFEGQANLKRRQRSRMLGKGEEKECQMGGDQDGNMGFNESGEYKKTFIDSGVGMRSDDRNKLLLGKYTQGVYQLKELGEVKKILGIEIIRDRSDAIGWHSVSVNRMRLGIRGSLEAKTVERIEGSLVIKSQQVVSEPSRRVSSTWATKFATTKFLAFRFVNDKWHASIKQRMLEPVMVKWELAVLIKVGNIRNTFISISGLARFARKGSGLLEMTITGILSRYVHTIFLYIDGMYFLAEEGYIGLPKLCLKGKFNLKELGGAKKILGMEIIMERSHKILRVSQSGLSFEGLPVRECDVERMSKVPYVKCVGSLMYLKVTRGPRDIAYLTKGTLEGVRRMRLNYVAVNCDSPGAIHLSRGILFLMKGISTYNVRFSLLVSEVLEAKDGEVLNVGTEHILQMPLSKVKVVLYRNMRLNKSEEYRKTFIGFSIGLLQGVEFEVEPQEDHTFEVEPHRNVDYVDGSQEVQTQDLIYYHSARDREQHSAWELFSYREDSNDAAFVVAVVDKIYAYESLTFNNTVACEVISKWKAGLKEEMDAQLDAYVLSNGCRKSSDDRNDYYWEYTPGEFNLKELGEAKKILGMEIIRDRSRKILRVSQSGYISKILNNFRIDNGKSVQMPLGGHFKLSLKDCPVRDCDVERMSKVPYANAVGSLMYLMGCVVSWKATLQHVVALSTTEAEYMALTKAGAIHLSRNHVFHERTKHINVRYHFIREVLEAKTVEVLKVGTEHNAADALTKVVPGHKLQHCLELLSVGIG
ncbi:hypothetical protein Tco_0351479 [Tanacetum coccineum]